MDKPRSPSVVAYWQDFCRARGVPEQPYDVCQMGDNPALADESLALILAGPKRATACLLRDVEQGIEMMARVGPTSWSWTARTGRAPSGGRRPWT